MSYIEKNVIVNNEKIVLIPKKNPIFLVFKWIWGILGFWLLFIPTYKAIKATVEFCTAEFAVTDKRVIEKYGWISTHTDEIHLSKIENVTVQYSFWGKIFNYATVVFQGANLNNVQFSFVKDAEKIKKDFNASFEN